MEAEERARPTSEDASAPTGSERTWDRRIDEGSDPANERAAPNERCAHHAGRPAVALCVACGEPVCLSCAVPVRGRILGPGCVADELGDPALLTPPDAEPGFAWTPVAGALVALAGTVGPWTRTGAGDRLFGAWVPDARWSIVAAAASLVLLWAAWRSGVRGASASVAVIVLAAVVLIGAGLAIAVPPTFQTASWGPWVTAAGGAIAALGAVLSGRARTQGV